MCIYIYIKQKAAHLGKIKLRVKLPTALAGGGGVGVTLTVAEAVVDAVTVMTTLVADGGIDT